MINYIRKSLLILLILVLSNADSLETNKSLELLSTRRILSYRQPFYGVSQNHIATFQAFNFRYNLILFKFSTYTLDGKVLKSCHATQPYDIGKFISYSGSLTSLGDNQTEVLMWIEGKGDSFEPLYNSYFYLHLRVIKPAEFNDCNDVNDDRFEISSLSLPKAYNGYVVPHVVPYVDSFDIVFPSNNREILKARYDNDGVIIRNPEILAKGESNHISSVNSVIKYDKSSNLLVIYEYPGSNLTAVLVNQKGEVLKRRALRKLTNERIQKYLSKYNTHWIFGEVDHGKLVFCDLRKKVTRCKRFNATTLESEILVEFESKELRPFGRIHLLPDGGFLLLQFDTREEDTVYTLTRVNADGSIWKTIEFSTCSVQPLSTYPYIYPKDDGVCLAYMCVGVEPFNMPNSNKRPYSTHINCYE